VPHSPQWTSSAAAESARLTRAIRDTLLTVHHIGSTAIPGICAKPILDLIPVFTRIESADSARPILEQLGYAFWGEYGLLGRRYCTFDDPVTKRRTIQLHCYAAGNPEITRHLAFRDYLLAHPDIAQAYAAEKRRCQSLHPLDSHAYSDCKGEWIQRVEQEGLRSRVEDQAD